MNDAYITGAGAFYPNDPVDNETIEAVLGKVNGQESWARPVILESCGIQRRHFSLHPETGLLRYTNAEMTARAVASAVENAGRSLKDLDLLATGTATPDQLNPGHGPMTHGELKSGPLETVSFAGFCASGMAALRYAYINVKLGERAVAAATGSELSSALSQASRFHLQDTSNDAAEIQANPVLSMNKEFLRWIAADGAAALIVEPRPKPDGISLRIDWMDKQSLAHEYNVCMYQGGEKDRRTGKLKGWLHEPSLARAVERNYFCISQDVGLLKEHVIQAGIHRVLKETIDKRQLRADDYDWFLPHLSSFFFKPRIEEALRAIGFHIPADRWYTNLDQVGNLGSAAMPSIIEQGLREGIFKKGQKILCGVPESGRFTYFYMQLTVV